MPAKSRAAIYTNMKGKTEKDGLEEEKGQENEQSQLPSLAF